MYCRILSEQQDTAPISHTVSGAGSHHAFVVRVRLDDWDTREKVENFRPTPGMPVDVFIETRQRTFFTYLIRPVIFSDAFREK
jgi:hypothetical protein